MPFFFLISVTMSGNMAEWPSGRLLTQDTTRLSRLEDASLFSLLLFSLYGLVHILVLLQYLCFIFFLVYGESE